MDQLTDYPCVANGDVSSYFSKEGILNDDSFSKITVNLTGNIFETAKSIRPDWIGTNKLNKEEIVKCSGYTLFCDDDSPIVLLDERFFNDSFSKNFIWIEVLIHEITHVCDFIRNKGIMGHDSFLLNKCIYFSASNIQRISDFFLFLHGWNKKRYLNKIRISKVLAVPDKVTGSLECFDIQL